MSNGFGNVHTLPPPEAGKFVQATESGYKLETIQLTIDDINLPDRLDSTGPVIPDCNLTQGSGWYRISNGLNCPPGVTPYGMLFHQGWDLGLPPGHAVQTFTPLYDDGGAMWLRICDTYVWKAWKKVAPIDDNNLPSRIKTVAQYISDFNAAMDSGWYWLPMDSANRPPLNTHYVVLANRLNTSNVRQIAYVYNDDQVWERRYSNAAWGAWFKSWPIDDTNLPGRLQSATSSTMQLADANLATQSGFYNIAPGAANAPDSSHWHLYVSAHSSGYVSQLAIHLYSNAIMLRRCVNGTWNAWSATLTQGPAGAAGATGATGPPGPTTPRLQHDTTTLGSTVTNWNDAVENGWHQGAPGTTNAPDGNWYVGHVVSHRSTTPGRWVTQEIFSFTTGIFSEPRWRRACLNDTWTGWQRISDQWIQSGRNGVTIDSNYQGWIYFPTAFPGTPHVVHTKDDGSVAGQPIHLSYVDNAKFAVAGVNHGEGVEVIVNWIAVYK